MHLADPAVAGAALAALARVLHAGVSDPRVRELRQRLVTATLAVDLCVDADAVLTDGTDDALLDAAVGIARVVDPASA